MKKNKFLIYVLLFMWIGTTQAQYTDLLDFAAGSSPYGAYPTGSLIVSGTVMYGMASNGGTIGAGCIYSVNTNGTAYQDLYNFSSGTPYGGLTFSVTGDTLFGMTYINAFSIKIDGTGYTNLHSFSGTTLGQDALASLTRIGNVLYGMTLHGGVSNEGNIFKIKTDGTGYADLFDFDLSLNGELPFGSLTPSLTGDSLFGTLSSGGAHGGGFIFSIKTDGTGFNDIYDFAIATGMWPYGDLLLYGKKFYGTTDAGGAYSHGVIFSVNTDGTSYSQIHDFNGTNGGSDQGSLTIIGNMLYGVTTTGGANSFGVLFAINTSGSGYIDLHDFNTSTGKSPYMEGPLLLTGNNNLYGVAEYGGANSDGVIFEYEALGVTASVTANVKCNGGNTGSVSSSASGGVSPYTYSWSPSGGTSSTKTGLSAGTYTITIQDNIGVVVTASVTITQPSALNASASTDNLSCWEASEPAVDVDCSPSGGALPYTYSWSPGGWISGFVNSGVTTGTYTVTLTDNCGVTATASVTVLARPSELLVSITSSGCSGPARGNIAATISGGTSPYIYAWSSGQTTSSLSATTDGNYTVTVTDNNACTATASIRLACPLRPIYDGVDNISQSQDISIYPNPNNGQFNIVGLDNGMILEVYDYMGRLISNITVNNETMQFNLSSQANGIYLIRIISPEGTLVKQAKMVKIE